MLSVVPRVKTISSAAGGAEVLGDAGPGAFVGFGRARTQLVQAAMDVGVVALVVTAERVEDRAGFLGGGGVIEVDERMPVDLLVENREILPQGLPIDGGCRRFGARGNVRQGGGNYKGGSAACIAVRSTAGREGGGRRKEEGCEESDR